MINIKSIARKADVVIMLAVFALCAIYIWSYLTVIKIPVKIWLELKPYMLQYSCTELILAAILVWKAARLGACKYALIATSMYGIMSISSFLYILEVLESSIFLSTIHYIGIGGIFLMLFLFIFDLCWLKFGKLFLRH